MTPRRTSLLSKGPGRWSAAEEAGKALPKEQVAKIKVVVKESIITIQEETASGTSNDRATFKLASATSPKSLDIMASIGGGAKKAADPMILGIYEIDGDNLKICWAEGKSQRPAKFATEPNSGQVLFVLKRQAKP